MDAPSEKGEKMTRDEAIRWLERSFGVDACLNGFLEPEVSGSFLLCHGVK